MSRIKLITVRVDESDFDAITEAIVLRKSALYRKNGEVVLPEDTESELTGALLAEVCRDWSEGLALGQVTLGERLLDKAAAQLAPHIASEPDPFHPEQSPDGAYLHEHQLHKRPRGGA
jgi:hypothetical protein